MHYSTFSLQEHSATETPTPIYSICMRYQWHLNKMETNLNWLYYNRSTQQSATLTPRRCYGILFNQRVAMHPMSNSAPNVQCHGCFIYILHIDLHMQHPLTSQVAVYITVYSLFACIAIEEKQSSSLIEYSYTSEICVVTNNPTTKVEKKKLFINRAIIGFHFIATYSL